MSWQALHVKPRCEKKVAQHCVRLGLTYYLPLRSETKIYQRRKVTVEKPLFPGYVFAGFDQDQRVELLKTNQIVRLLEPVHPRLLLYQLAQIRRALRADPRLETLAGIKPGRQVRIKAGPFMGVDGTIASVKGVERVVLNVDMIGQAVVVEVDRACIEVLE